MILSFSSESMGNQWWSTPEQVKDDVFGVNWVHAVLFAAAIVPFIAALSSRSSLSYRTSLSSLPASIEAHTRIWSIESQ